jgi:hypothetical protein
MNNSWKNWAIALLLLLNGILIFTLVLRRAPHPPRLAKELTLSKEKTKAVEVLEEPFLNQRKKQKDRIRTLEHRLIKSALSGDSLQVESVCKAVLSAKQQDLKRMTTYFERLGVLLNKSEEREVLHIIGTFDRKPRP